MTGRFTAPSDFDYYDGFDSHSGIERTCTGCGDPVMVDRGEMYQLQVFCEACREAAIKRQQQPKGDAA